MHQFKKKKKKRFPIVDDVGVAAADFRKKRNGTSVFYTKSTIMVISG